jgi:membrane protease YdiL (CAAX protease family)
VTALQPRPQGDAPAAGTSVAGAARAERGLLERTVLDEQVTAAQQADPRPWGLRPWLGPLLALVALSVGAVGITAALPSAGTVVGLVVPLGGELALLAVVVACGRPLAARSGGWRVTFGLDRVRRSDWLPWITGMGLALAGRALVGVVAVALSDGRANLEASNLTGGDGSVLSIVGLVLLAVVLAPVVEELMFRGLMLRTFMRRLGFWASAVLSTVLFAGLHAPQVDTLGGALTLTASVAVLGLCNCYLVRITGRLTPGILVHATCNALAVALVLTLAAG